VIDRDGNALPGPARSQATGDAAQGGRPDAAADWSPDQAGPLPGDLPPFDHRLFEQQGVVIERGDGPLWVVFTGLGSSFGGTPIPEFRRTLVLLGGTRVFLRDPSQSWYALGIDEAPECLPVLLQDLVDQAERTIFLGSSMGAYAALLYSAMVGGVDVVHAFGPQSTIDPVVCESIGDHRYRGAFERIRRRLVWPGQQRQWDLQVCLPARPEVERWVHVCEDDPLDARHASRLTEVPNLIVRHWPCRGHNPAGWLKETGMLAEVIG